MILIMQLSSSLITMVVILLSVEHVFLPFITLRDISFPLLFKYPEKYHMAYRFLGDFPGSFVASNCAELLKKEPP